MKSIALAVWDKRLEISTFVATQQARVLDMAQLGIEPSIPGKESQH